MKMRSVCNITTLTNSFKKISQKWHAIVIRDKSPIIRSDLYISIKAEQLIYLIKISRMTMNTKTTLAVSLAGIFAISMIFATSAIPAHANPPGIPADEKMVYKFNYHAIPEGSPDQEPNCGSGAKIYSLLGERSGHIQWTLDTADSSPHIADCKTESLDGDYANVHVEEAGKYNVYVRIHGANDADNNLRFCINTLTDELGDHLCLLGDFTVGKSKTFTKTTVSSKLFADSNEDIVYHIDQSSKFRIAEFRLYALA